MRAAPLRQQIRTIVLYFICMLRTFPFKRLALSAPRHVWHAGSVSLLLLLVVHHWRRVGEDEDVKHRDEHHDGVLEERPTRTLERVRVVFVHAVPTMVANHSRVSMYLGYWLAAILISMVPSTGERLRKRHLKGGCQLRHATVTFQVLNLCVDFGSI